MILRDAFVSINGTDFTDECREVNVDDGRAEHDNTVMRMSAESVEAGLAQWTITVKLRQNYAPGKVHSVIRPLIGTICTVVVRPDANRAAGPDNEEVHGTGIFLKYVPIGGAAGQPQEPTLEFKNTGTALTYSGGALADDEGDLSLRDLARAGTLPSPGAPLRPDDDLPETPSAKRRGSDRDRDR